MRTPLVCSTANWGRQIVFFARRQAHPGGELWHLAAEDARMFGVFKRGPCGDGARPSLDAIRFDTTGYDSQGEPQPGKVRVWHTPQGDGLGVYFFGVPPNLPANAAPIESLASFYRDHRRGIHIALIWLQIP
jgi:hypothetical protein